MKNRNYLILALLSLCSCELLKKNTQSIQTTQQKEEVQLSVHRTLLAQKSELLLVDTSDRQFTMMVWPKGKFRFSLTEGFEGEAEKILIKGKQTAKQSLQLKQSAIKDSVAVNATYAKEKASLTSVEKKKNRIGFNWSWLLVAVGFFLACWAYKRIS